jgi:glycosyltransferase involved in cell wall biosynthesis
MFFSKTIAVIIPAYNEMDKIFNVLSGIPDFVDHIIVIDDGSTDRTENIVSSRADIDRRISIVRHETNEGVGGAIISGYKAGLRKKADIMVVVAGDGQMDSSDMIPLIEPVAEDAADYSKGNRLWHPELLKSMPVIRLIGNIGLTLATKITSGYSHIWDSQCGYSAVSSFAVSRLPLDSIYKGYGFPNDFLSHLHSINARVEDVVVKPVYAKDGNYRSGISVFRALFTFPLILIRSMLFRCQREFLNRNIRS